MKPRLNSIENWSEIARQAKWSASALAEKCGVSVRTLERHFLKQMGQSPKAWLLEQRQSVALERLRNGCSVKEATSQAGYEYASTFSREFKKYWGFCPATQCATSKTTKVAPVA